MKRLIAAASAAALVFTVAPASAQSEPVKIAHVYGKTGALEAYGKQSHIGLMMGLEYATDGTMEIDGRKIEVLEKDTQGKPDVGKAALAEAYGDDEVDLAVGPVSSGVALAMLPVAQEYEKILIVEPAVADSITGANRNRYIFRTGRNSSQDAIANAVALGGENVKIATLAQDYAFGRDFDALKDEDGRKFLFVIWAGGNNPIGKIKAMAPERFDIEIATGGNILAAMAAYKDLPGMEGATYYYHEIPKNPINDWLVSEHEKRYGQPPDFFTAGGMAAGLAIVEAIKATGGSTETDDLIAAMEGMEFETPKGKMVFRKEDHQALQSMYHFKIRVEDDVAWGIPELVRELKIEDMDIPVRD